MKMAWTKRQLINQAFDELGFSEYNFDLDPAQLQSALRKLDAMTAQWNIRGIRIGYPLNTNVGESLIDSDSGVQDYSIEAIYKNLAISIAPSLGKTVSRDTKKDAKLALNTMLMLSTKPQEMQITGLPRGAGNKHWRTTENPFLDRPRDPLLAGGDSEINFY